MIPFALTAFLTSGVVLLGVFLKWLTRGRGHFGREAILMLFPLWTLIVGLMAFLTIRIAFIMVRR